MVKHAKPVVHGRDHEHGGADPHRIHYEDVGDAGGGISSEITIKKNGTTVGTRPNLNLHEGTNVTITATDDSTNDEVDITIAATGGGGGGTGVFYDVENKDGDVFHVEAVSNIDFSVPVDAATADLAAFGLSEDAFNVSVNWVGSLPGGIASTGVFFFAPIITICGLPTSAPSESNRLWNDGGTLKIT